MKNKIIYLIALLIISCQNPSEKLKQENQALTQENASLKKGHQSVSEMNSKLKKENENYKKLIPILKFSSKSIVSDTLAYYIYNDLVHEAISYSDSKNDTSYQFLYNFSFIANLNRNPTDSNDINDLINFPNTSFYLHYLWKNIDRSPANLKSLFNKNKNIAYRLLKNGNSYESSGLKRTIKTLLLSYQEIHNKQELLEDLHKRTLTIGVLSDTIYNTIESPKMTKLISKFRDSEYVSYNSWIYSFWMRRHQEKNTEVVYKIIKEFDKEMTLDSLKENHHF